MIFVYLIFAHLAADFVLQPAELVKWKYRNWRGIALHSVIHLLFYYTVFFAYLTDWRIPVVLAGLALAHFFVDFLKIRTESKAKSFVGTFFADQFFHLLTIILAGLFILDSRPGFLDNAVFRAIYGDFYILGGLSLLIIVSYAVEAAKFQFVRKTVGEAGFKPDYKKMFRRIMIFSIIYALILFFSIYRTAAFT